MKKIGFWILAFLVGELVAIAHKDKQFKKNLQKKEGLERWKYIFQSLFDFNKELVQQAPSLNEVKAWAQDEYAIITDKVGDLEENLEKRSEEKAKPHLEEIESRFEEYKSKVMAYGNEINLDAKIETIKKKIDLLKKKFK